MSEAPIPQRATLVLPSTAEFDSRTYRIAGSLAARGHEVTVLARMGPGLAAEEAHPAGYRIIRVPVDAIDGLPLPLALRRALRRARRRQVARVSRTGSDGDPAGPSAAPGSAAIEERRAGSRVRRVAAALRRVAAIALVVRSQGRACRAVDAGADIYHGMAYMGVPVALDLARRHATAHTIYDARDIYVDARNLARLPRPARSLVARVERGWARRVDQVITVNEPYAEVMARRWSIAMPLVVMNCSSRFQPPLPRERRFHDRLGLDPATRVVLYQGGLSTERGIEQLLEAIPAVDGAVVVLMGYGPLKAALEARLAEPPLRGRAFVMDAVPPEELLDWVACADVVAIPIQPSTLNHRLTTPNKLLEAIAAGVPVVASDLPGMAPIVRDAACGTLCDPADPASIAVALRGILDLAIPERQACADRALAAARDRYNWESQMERLLEAYGRLTGRPW